MNYRMIKHTLGWVLNIEGASMLLPLACAFIYKENCVWVFSVCILLCILLGTLFVIKPPQNKTMYSKDTGYTELNYSIIYSSRK